MALVGPPLILLAILGSLLALVVAARLAVRARVEVRVRVLETVAAATRRGVPVEAPFLWQIAHDVRGRRRRAVLHAASLLDAGEPVGAALAVGLRLPAAVAASVRAADGRPGLGTALVAAARLDRDHAGAFHRLLLVAALPLVTIVGAALLPSRFLLEVAASMNTHIDEVQGAVLLVHGVAWALGGGLVLVLLSRLAPVAVLLDRLRRLLPRPGHRALAGWLAALASAVRVGRPMHDAVERTVAAIGNRRMEQRLRVLSAQVGDGVHPATAWAALPLPRWLRARGVLLSGASESVAAALDDMAQRAHERADAARERFFALLHPALTVVVGLALGSLFLALLQTTQRLALQAGPW